MSAALERVDLIDIGANLTHDSFDPDRDALLERAEAAGVRRLIVTGASAEGSRAALQLTRRYPGKLFATAGVHPHHADDYSEQTSALLVELAGHSEVVAIGECGLDYFRNFSEPGAQRQAFTQQLQVAVDVDKPVFLHQRDAHEDFLEILSSFMPKLRGGVAHCFTGDANQMQAYLDLGLYIGITGWICDERRGQALQDAVRHLPVERILLETDAPYLLPRDLAEKPAGRRNEPAVLPHVLEAVAGFMGLPVADVAAAATRNTEALFGIGS